MGAEQGTDPNTTFQIQNRFVILLASCSGLYLTSTETLIKNRIVPKILKWYPLIFLIPALTMYASSLQVYVTVKLSRKEAVNITRRFIVLLCLGCKILYLAFNRRHFEHLFCLWNTSFQENLFDRERQARLSLGRRKMNKKILIIFISNLIPVILVQVPYFLNPLKKGGPEPTFLPFRDQSPDYELHMLMQLFRNCFMISGSTAFDALCLAILTSLSIQLEHLKYSLARIIKTFSIDEDGRLCITSEQEKRDITRVEGDKSNDNDRENCQKTNDKDDNKSKKEKEEEMKKLLVTWIKHHQDVIRFCKAVNKVFHPILSFQMAMVSIYVVLAGVFLNAFTPPVPVIIALVTYSLSNYLMFFMLAYNGDKITEGNADIFDQAFGHDWYIYPKPVKSCLHIIIMMSQRTLALYTWHIYPFSMKRLAKMMRLAYNLFAFMRQMLK